MKSLKHIFGLLMMSAMIIAAGCNKEENGGKKENYPHPTSTYKACPILAHFSNEKLGIKEINRDGCIYTFDKEQRLIKVGDGTEVFEEYEYQYNSQGKLTTLKNKRSKTEFKYDIYGFVDSIYNKYENGIIFSCFTFIYSKDTVLIKHEWEDEGKWVEIKYIQKFSDDLYPIYHVEDKWWCKYNWKNGNLIDWYSSDGDKNEYQYDNSPNIYRLLLGCDVDVYFHFLMGDPKSGEMYTKNNPNNSAGGVYYIYTYDNKGMVKTMTFKSKTDNQDLSNPFHFDYIYY